MTDRRAFMRSSCAVAACLTAADANLLFAAPAESDKSAGPWLKKTLKIGMIREGADLTEKFQLAKLCGFAGVELNAPGIKVDEAKKAVEASGIPVDGTVGGQHWGVRHSDPDPAIRAKALQQLKDGIAETAAVGGDTMLLVPGHGKDGSPGEVYGRSLINIRKALPDAEKHGVRIVMENVWNHFLYDHSGGNDQTGEAFAAYIDAFDSPFVGAQFDIGNHWKYGDPAAWIRTLGPRIMKLDIKGYSREKQGWANITKGDIDWAEVRQALRDVNFTGWVAAEVGGGGEKRLREVAANMEAALHCSAVATEG